MNMRWTKPYLPQPWLWLTLASTVLLVVAACGPAYNRTPATTPTPTPLSTPTATSVPITTPSPAPSLEILSPAQGATIPAGDVTISLQISNFRVVNKLGQASVSGEGHLHYFKDVDAPTTPGQGAITSPGTYAAATQTSHTWSSVSPGPHTFSVEIVNNDHTPLSPPVTAKISVTVSGSAAQTGTTIEVSAQNLAFDKKTITVPAGAKVSIAFTNKESVPHNIAIYETAAATKALFIGEVISGPRTITYQFTAPTTPGTYFFHCDVHPGIMTGSFVVTSAGGSDTGAY